MKENIKKGLVLLSALESNDSKVVVEAVNKIKETGDIHYIPHLIEKLSSTSDDALRKQILNLLHTVKDKKATAFYIEAIDNGKNKKILKDLLQFCWESGFDLSPYGQVFLKVAIEEEYEIAIEAFSAIEENIMDFTEEQKQEHVKYLKERLSSVDEVKKALIVELVNLLSN